VYESLLDYLGNMKGLYPKVLQVGQLYIRYGQKEFLYLLISKEPSEHLDGSRYATWIAVKWFSLSQNKIIGPEIYDPNKEI